MKSYTFYVRGREVTMSAEIKPNNGGGLSVDQIKLTHMDGLELSTLDRLKILKDYPREFFNDLASEVRLEHIRQETRETMGPTGLNREAETVIVKRLGMEAVRIEQELELLNATKAESERDKIWLIDRVTMEFARRDAIRNASISLGLEREVDAFVYFYRTAA